MNKPRVLARFDPNEEWLIEEIDKIAKEDFSSRSTIVKQALAGYILEYKRKKEPESKKEGSD